MASRGFKTSPAIAQNRLGNTTTRRKDVRHSSFVEIGDKSVGETYLCLQIVDTAEPAAARGTCGTCEVTA